MTKMRLRSAACLFVLTLSFAAAAADGGAKSDRVERLTDLVVRMIPLGTVFDSLAASDPKWPVQEKPDALNAQQLACLRTELSSDGYRRSKREEVAAYVAKHSADADAQITLLAGGAADLMGKLMLAGAEQERTGKEYDESALIAEFAPTQIASFMEVMTSPDQAALRKLAGIGNAYTAGQSQEENASSGEQAGQNLAMQAVLGGMGRCHIPTSAFLD